MINIILGIIFEAAMTTRAAMDASKLGAKKMLFVLGKTQPSDWASKKIHEHKTTCGGERKDTTTKQSYSLISFQSLMQHTSHY